MDDEHTLLKKRKKAEKEGNVKLLVEVCRKLGDIYYDAKKFDLALEAYEKQLYACECEDDQLNCAKAHRMIGEVQAEVGNIEKALEHQKEYLRIAKGLQDLVEEQRAYATLGRTYLFQAEREDGPKDEILKKSKNSFQQSIKLCDRLNNHLSEKELIIMRARLLLNLGLVLEQQKDLQKALNLISQAATMCKEHKLHEEKCRTYIALGAILERKGDVKEALQKFTDAAKVDDPYMKVDALVLKSELLLKQGEWFQGRIVLQKAYKYKNVASSAMDPVKKLLRIAVVLCRREDELIHTSDPSRREKIYEEMGDAATECKSLDKAIEYYEKMVECAEKTGSPKLGAALNSVAQTLKDLGKFGEAIPYARREMELCKDPKETANSAVFLAGLMSDAQYPHSSIKTMYQKALNSARDSNDEHFEKTVTKIFIEYLEKLDNDIDESLKNELNAKWEELDERVESQNTDDFEMEGPEIGADIDLDGLSDPEVEEKLSSSMEQQPSNVARTTRRPKRCVVKKMNEKGETKLHIACMKEPGENDEANIKAVEKLLAEGHPVDVRDNTGWTPLHEAANFGHVEIAKLLLNAGASVNDPGGELCEGVTALHDAATNGHFSMMQLLLDHGADPNLRNRAGDTALDCLLTHKEKNDIEGHKLKEYLYVKSRLEKTTKVKRNKSKSRNSDSGRRGEKLKALIDENDSDDSSPSETYAKPEKISAGEDYKRTIASLQHPGRSRQVGAQPSAPTKITAPLIDNEEMLAQDEDWLIDDLGLNSKGGRKDNFFDYNGLKLSSSTAATTTATPAKRKSIGDEELIEMKKPTKKQKFSEGLIDVEESARVSKSLEWRIRDEDFAAPMSDENSCESTESTSARPVVVVQKEIWPRAKKRARQTNLLKQGFVVQPRAVESRSPSPEFVPIAKTSPVIYKPGHERHSWDSGTVSDSLDLDILVDGHSFQLKLHGRDLRKTMTDIENLIRDKFEVKTGCRPIIRFKTETGCWLEPNSTLEQQMPNHRKILNLVGEITQNVLAPIVDRYKKICENLGIAVTEQMVKSLRSCENTLTFRLNSSDSYVTEELDPLITCLHYQENLQILNLSTATFYRRGQLLDYCLARLNNLCELHLQCCDIDADCLEAIDALPAQLRVLDLSYNRLGNRSQKKLFKLLEPLARLQRLVLRSCDLTAFDYTFRSASLIDLDVSWNPVGGSGAANLIQNHLLNLNLSNTQKLRDNVIDKIFFNDSLNFSFLTLESLELSCCDATDLDVEKILSKAPNLTRINLNNNINVTKTSLCAILSRKTATQYVDFSDCRTIDSAPESRVQLVAPQHCTVRVTMTPNVIQDWERLWLGRGRAKRLPEKLVVFGPF
ncbi:tonsoku-like protein [Trichogramma pretiosum]|uniref:tonsoku-like protein n=1 Tax=Trichogramma pretiosum TaxID=7493 RepID=UPI0006C95E69|nr:tonsoku-like protein [Trichogramma pretiosum]